MPAPLEIPPERVEEFAQAARQKIDARLLRAKSGGCPEFWALVAKLYVRESANASTTWLPDRGVTRRSD